MSSQLKKNGTLRNRPTVLLMSRRNGRRQDYFQVVQTQRLIKGWRHTYICLVSTCGTPMSAVVFHSAEKSLAVSLCQTRCMSSVLQKTETKNPGGASAPLCTCLWAFLVSVSKAKVVYEATTFARSSTRMPSPPLFA